MLRRILCKVAGEFWTSEDEGKIKQIDGKWYLLKEMKVAGNSKSFSADKYQDLIFIVRWTDTKIYKYEV